MQVARLLEPRDERSLSAKIRQLIRAVQLERRFSKPEIMGPATKYLLPNQKVMGFAMRMMANLTDGRDGDAQDKLFYLLERMARAS